MTLQDIKRLTAFNAWASNRIFDALAALPAEEFTRDMKASHGSIHGTLTHMVGAEKMWLSRMVGTPDKAMIKPADVPTLAEVKKTWEETGFNMAKFLGTLTDRKLQETFPMTTSTGQQFIQAYGDALQHVVDHSTYHRAQVVTLMRQMGHTPPSAGMMGFFRETAKAQK
ncbi:MAG TPA: DinB family protein [Bacteroidota bacterium]|nr:DinB family protein [Bacteroidota bacterium]